ncbi:retinol dehydrogenase 14-like [Cimex lectularius]|uniref:Uncharacterized protein n=1 Tax=Cimex lectularius TaxID=79782 RepID=A0A8I6R8Y0_CIMLE|nr:retinol dehydrogenase 14-like [Cimex lectularius]
MGARGTKLASSARLDGKTAVVTGSSAGIGKVTAKELFRLGARVIMACRDVKKAEEVAESIKTELSDESNLGELVVKQLNLGSLASVKNCADDLKNTETSINLLINNAGVMACPLSKTEDNFEMQFGVNHLGHFVFTNILLPKIIASAPSRIINLSSSAHEYGELVWDDINFERRTYRPIKAYAQSKLANVLFSIELARQLKDKGVTVYSVHPGVVKTELGRHFDDTYFWGARKIINTLFYPFYKTAEEGAMTTLYCALKEDVDNSGAYFSNCKMTKTFDDEKYANDAKTLWDKSVDMTKKFLDISYTN